jgi:hypothetical protein
LALPIFPNGLQITILWGKEGSGNTKRVLPKVEENTLVRDSKRKIK